MNTPPARARRDVPPALPSDATRSYREGIPWFLLAVTFLGFLVSLYLTLLHYRGVLPNCYVVQGCDVVQTSRYSAILGVPIALFGTAYFALMFYLAIGLMTNRTKKLVATYKVLAFAGALAAIPLFLLQAVVLEAFCTYCLVTEGVLLLMWTGSLVLKAADQRTGGTEDGQSAESAGHSNPEAAGDRRSAGRRARAR